jgi:hypothetical protein
VNVELYQRGHLERIRSPYLVVAGEFDGLNPLLEHNQTEWCKPRQLAIYARHSAPPEGFALKEHLGKEGISSEDMVETG